MFVLRPVCCSARQQNLAFVTKGYRHSALENMRKYLQEATIESSSPVFQPGNEAMVVYNM